MEYDHGRQVGRDLVRGIIPIFAWTWVRLADNPVEIRTGHSPDTCTV
jgi:hypothetical protein